MKKIMFFWKNMICTEEYNGKMNMTLKSLSDKIRELKAVVSGSFVSSVILNENYFNDIDIYLLKRDESFNKWIIDNMGGVFREFKSYFGIGKDDYKFICMDINTKKVIIINIIIVNVDTTQEIKDYI